MDIQDRVKDHLIKFRKSQNMNQPEMAAFIDIGYRTYQSIEKDGYVAKADDLLKIMARTGFTITQEIADPFLVEEPISLFISHAANDHIAMLAAIQTLTEKAIELEMRETKKSKKIVSSEFDKTMKANYNRLLDQSRTG